MRSQISDLVTISSLSVYKHTQPDLSSPMYQVFNCIANEHDFAHVLMAVFVLAFSSLCTLIVFHRSQAAESVRGQRMWVTASGFVMGLGIWATHFIALLGYEPGFEVVFDGWITLLSPLISVTGFIVVAHMISINNNTHSRVACAIIASLTVACMHFYGVSALKGSAVIEYDLVTVAFAVGIGFASFLITYLLVSKSDQHMRNLLAWLASLAAVISIHFVSASGTTMIPINGISHPVWELGTGSVSAFIAIGIGTILIVSALAAGLDTAVQGVRVSEHRKLALLADSALEALFIVSPKGLIVDANKAAETIFGTPRDALRGSDSFKIMQLDDVGDVSLVVDHDFGERPLHFPGGRKVIVDINSRVFDDKVSAFTVFAVRDLTQRLRNEARVRALAYQDPLTGLANRVTFNMALASAIRKSPGAVHDLAVLIIDVDDFNEVNDQFGHRAGDVLLKTVAKRIKSSIHQTDLVARLSGDEYAVILRGRTSKAEINAAAQSMLSAISAPLEIGQRTLAIGASIGISVGAPPSGGPTRVLTSADRALYAAKGAGRGRVQFYDTRLHREHEQKRGLERELHQAVLLEQFELHYQPKVCSNTRAVLGREALIRWNHPKLGMVFPDTFIPIAEQSLLINQIGKWTIRAACEEASNWDESITVSVNLSAKQFLDPDLVQHVRLALLGSGIKPARLELEVTETALIQNQLLAVAILNELKVMGVQIALDDFGTGYSSMSYIQSFPFDRIKIDRSFVAAMNVDHKSRAIVEAIIHLAHSLQIPVVAEGVETEDQALALCRLACEELQGYLIARPGPMAADHRMANTSRLGNSLTAA